MSRMLGRDTALFASYVDFNGNENISAFVENPLTNLGARKKNSIPSALKGIVKTKSTTTLYDFYDAAKIPSLAVYTQ